MTPSIRRPSTLGGVSSEPALPTTGKTLPSWPIVVLLWGFPFWWAAGAAPFVPIGLAFLMCVLLIQQGQIRLTPGLIPWIAFLGWVGVASISLDSAIAFVGFGQRYGNLIAVGVFMVYYVNAGERLNTLSVLKALTAFYIFVVLMGFLATIFPEFRLTTPVGIVLPDVLMSNPLVYDLVLPRLAEIQQPWGAPEPFNRPSAPFPFANSWGVAFVVLTPVVLALISRTRSRSAKVLLTLVVCASFYPALETSNRGMFIGLAASIGYVAVRLAMKRRFAPLLLLLAAALAGVVFLLESGAADTILGRQKYSDSTSGRASIYRATIEAVLRSPLIGYGAPRLDESIGVALGTQGYIWMLAFSYGLVGLLLFCVFFGGIILRTVHVHTMCGLWLHSALVAAVVTMSFYSFDVMQMSVVALAAAVLLRDRYRDGRAL